MASLPSFGDWRRLAADPAWAAAVEEPGDGFALFVACDATELSAELIEEFASYCIDRGLYWVSTWGADCERVHDTFDSVDIARAPCRAVSRRSTFPLGCLQPRTG